MWHTLQTPHFEITYHDPLGAIAQHLAAAAERANEKLSRALGFRASQRVLILLTDETDDANGIANVLPRDQLHLFASAPDDLSPIADYDDWIATLVTHEHTHILHMDQIGGLPALVNVLLGKSVAPNSIQPRWFIEGIATYEESKQTSGGRGRSTIFDMMLRADVLEERWLPLDAISNDPVRWPHGDIRYLYGSRFLTFIAERYGDAALTRMGLDYGRQAIPYGLNRIAKRATGFTFTELYEQFHAALRERYGAQRDAIVQAGVVEGRALTAHADLARSPRFLRDGRLVFYRSDGHSPEGVYVLDGTRITRLTRSSGEASVAVHPDGRSLVFSQNGPYRDIYSFHDLFRFDLTSGELERLTTGLRASQPDVSPNGREVVFVTQKNGGSRLELAALDDVEGSRRPLSCGEDCAQVYTPRFSPDGKTVAVSAWRRGGYRDVLLIDRASGLVRELTHDRAQDTGPVFSPDGKRVYFSSDRTGVANLYAFELDSGQTVQLSNVVMGAYQPQVSPDGTKLVYVGYASHGFGLHELALSDVTPRTAEPYRNERPAQDVVVEHAPVPVEDYDPTRTLPPNNYQLDLQRAALGYELGIHIAGSDIAGFHRYRVLITSTFDPVEAGVSVHYAYGRSPLAPTLHVFRTIAARSDLKVGGK
ncbi:MAG TPA: hypothetical protein VHM19_18345, partial [Polyangiales bacterium]|nr:hypothetical protein [Polyangiales bacterium]